MTFAFHATHPSKENIVGFLMGGGGDDTVHFVSSNYPTATHVAATA